jgi:hypothetical protein
MAHAAVDNDVLLKGASYGMLREFITAIPSVLGETLVLGTARFVVVKRLEKHRDKGDVHAAAAIEQFRSVLQQLATAEPTAAELELAATFEHLAQHAGLALDSGESQLCALTICRQLAKLVTGDKRAIGALEALARISDQLSAVAGKVVCLEQLVIRLLDQNEAQAVRSTICSRPHVDAALAICFSCSSPTTSPDSWVAGLESYVRALREAAPTLLEP